MKIEEEGRYIELKIIHDGYQIGEAEINELTKQLTIFRIYEPFQDLGLGQKILKQILDQYDVEWLEVSPSNERAIHIYKKNKFKLTEPTLCKMELKK